MTIATMAKETAMRDPARIRRILKLISKLWHANPDQRLGQLLFNYAEFEDGDYHVEDETTELRLTVACEKINK